MCGITVVASCGNLKTSICIRRPIKWENVYNGYPKNSDGNDLPSNEVFKLVRYDYKNIPEFGYGNGNACAIRVSIALIRAGMKVEKEYEINSEEEDLKSKNREGFIAKAEKLKDWLSKPEIWGDPDVTVSENDLVEGKDNFDVVREKINTRDGVYAARYGIYIITGGFYEDPGVTGHATLWVGEDTIKNSRGDHTDYSDYIGKKDSKGNKGVVHFWELK